MDFLLGAITCLVSVFVGAWLTHRANRGESPLPPAPKLTKPHKVRPAVRDEDADYDG